MKRHRAHIRRRCVNLAMLLLVPWPDIRPAVGAEPGDKTFVAWVHLTNTTQRGGSALTLMEGEDFDALVFGERVAGRWMAGSDFFRRTQSEQAQKANPAENAAPTSLVQVAIAYTGKRVSIFRDGQPYVSYEAPQARSFGGNATVLLGLRYLGEMGEIGFFTGALEEVRLYGTGLRAEQISALALNQPSDPPPLAWWTFEESGANDLMKVFPAARLEGSARIANGKLILDGSGYLWAAPSARQLTTEPEDEEPFDPALQTLFYKARSRRTGNMWDTWLFRHEGTNYLYYLAKSRGQWDNISMATSTDGVAWREVGRVLAKRRGVTWMGTGSTWKSPTFERDGKFIMNFSEWKGPRQTIFFAESRDLIHWSRLGDDREFAQDERWYEGNGRWDCIWTMPRPGGGLYGYWTATPKAGTGGRFGFGETLDGTTWRALPPPKVSGVGEGEVGAIAKIRDRYYMMFGTGGRMATLVSARPEGPFEAALKNPTLLAGHTYFSRFHPHPDGLLVNHHSIARDGQVSLGTLKAARTEGDGTLRLAWWTGNEKLKRSAVEAREPAQPSPIRAAVTMLDGRLDTDAGIILEGLLKLPGSPNAPPVGLLLPQRDGNATAIRVTADGSTEFGRASLDGTGFQPEHRVNRDWEFGPTARFRLLLKGSLSEFYLDDILMECYSMPHPASGSIGFLAGQDDKGFSALKAWQTNLP